ncbi:type I-C CRISPR-associated protein Cas7/Csd2 [Synergistales bacterium]|nr:type I-C CRISPR-associated protein Cas7/Csd2 [Synergistales bacterium]
MSKVIGNRYEFVLYFDVENGNPNGDPDSGNMPRIDPQTRLGIVTDVCIKRKVRNYVEIVKERSEGYDLYVSMGDVLNNKHKLAYEANEIPAKEDKKESKLIAQQYMCKRFFDIRMFGAVLETGDYKCGQVCGPIQICFAKSQDKILQQEITIHRMSSTNEEERDSENHTIGRKCIVPYALYRMEGFISAKFAEKTGFNEDDLSLFWDALKNMFDHDHSAARGRMSSRKLFVFKHNSAIGNAPAITLFDKVSAKRVDDSAPPRKFTDYAFNVDREMPKGVEFLELL